MKTKNKVSKHEVEFSIGNDTYFIDCVKVKHWKELSRLLKEPDTHVNRIKILCLLSGCPEQTFGSIERVVFNQLWNTLQENVLAAQEVPFAATLDFNGTGFGFFDLSKITVAEMASLEIFLTGEDHISDALAVMYRPIINNKTFTAMGFEVEPYDTALCQGRKHLFDEVDVNIVHGCSTFFLTFASKCSNVILKNLVNKTMNPKKRKLLQNVRALLTKIGSGSPLPLQEVIQSSMSLLKS